MKTFYILLFVIVNFAQLSAQDNVTIKGKIQDNCPEKSLIYNVQIKFYELGDEGEKELYSTTSKDGLYSIEVKPNFDYRIELEHKEYRTTSSYIRTSTTKELSKNLTMRSKQAQDCLDVSKKEVIIQGRVFDNKNHNKVLKNVFIGLYEVDGLNEKMINGDFLKDGYYSFKLNKSKDYRLQIELKGYKTVSFHTTTMDYKKTLINWNLPIELSDGEEKEEDSEEKTKEVVLKGKIFNAAQPNQFIIDVNFKIYILHENGTTELFQSGSITENVYFTIRTSNRYKIELSHKDFKEQLFLVDTFAYAEKEQIDMDFYMFPN